MSGLNEIDPVRWRELGISETYWKLVKKLSTKKESTVLASMLTFQDLIYALDSEWIVSGLGHDYGISIHGIKKAAVLHYNGNMKPWLELGIRKYKVYWKKFLNCENHFLKECNVNP
ncbi:hypothetical protein F3Y22_tig00013960pilonHSYRG00356 [Hibiscus syriacus]|uniref:Hexosyltransferase n=1 Tax=Hibiscus syriacus TaxID=106335 RepID=A0A6A3C6E2_HIBSY|nr:hypothetical protein F3Y22_tig00013960pilonHSYRG00356 [Hibiscus syriacus]